ncbi:MAG: metal ABC transporter substrate-binding protein [Actinomycetota bacterium]
MRRLLALLAVAAVVLLGAACGSSSAGGTDDAEVDVVGSFYPLAFVAQEVGGTFAEVHNLTPAGAEPHDLELTIGEIRTAAGSDLLIHLGGGFQPAVEDVVAERDEGVLEVLEELDGGRPEDPHVWLDPVLMTDVTRLVEERLAELDPRRAEDFEANADSLRKDLDALDGRYRDRLGDCKIRAFVTSHDAFSYLARRYDLRQIGIAGVDPEAEPTPQSVAGAARFARANDVTTIFYETLVSPKIAETVAEEVGVRTEVLDPLELVPDNGDYISVMDSNLDALAEAMRCR